MTHTLRTGCLFEELSQTIDEIIENYDKYHTAVPVTLMVDLVKSRPEYADMSEGGLYNIVANHLILRGYSVYFDKDVGKNK